MYQPRIYIHGDPNSDKTGALVRTAKKKLGVINAPGETGYATIPDGDPDIVRFPSFDPTLPSQKILSEVQKVVGDAIKSGKFETIAFEGIHNLMDYVMDFIMGGAYFQGQVPDWWKVGNPVYRWMDNFISKLVVNNVPQVVTTGWSRSKPERKAVPPEKPEDVPQMIVPNLMGQYTQIILGRIPWVFHQTLRVAKDGKGANILDKEGRSTLASFWQIRPHGRIKGVGMKVPRGIEAQVAQFPLFIPADYAHLETLWKGLDI